MIRSLEYYRSITEPSDCLAEKHSIWHYHIQEIPLPSIIQHSSRKHIEIREGSIFSFSNKIIHNLFKPPKSISVDFDIQLN